MDPGKVLWAEGQPAQRACGKTQLGCWRERERPAGLRRRPEGHRVQTRSDRAGYGPNCGGEDGWD